MHLSALKGESLEELTELAAGLQVTDPGNLRRQELVLAILAAQGERRGDLMPRA